MQWKLEQEASSRRAQLFWVMMIFWYWVKQILLVVAFAALFAGVVKLLLQ